MIPAEIRKLARPYASDHTLRFDDESIKSSVVTGKCGCGETFAAAATSFMNGVLRVGRLHAQHLARVQLLLAN